ncbi:MAG: hypothetical protein KAS39_00395, partial [Actinomycetia bacterium]|nr:hypothetical protein [Actinomycetes bacterium]
MKNKIHLFFIIPFGVYIIVTGFFISRGDHYRADFSQNYLASSMFIEKLTGKTELSVYKLDEQKEYFDNLNKRGILKHFVIFFYSPVFFLI